MANKNNNNDFSGELNSQSMAFLGLNKQAFAEEILSDKSFFKPQALTKIIDNLVHQVQFSDLILVIEGTQGSGKTSLFRQFIQSNITNTKILSIFAEATDTLVQIQQKMSIHLQELGDANHLNDNLKNLQMFDQTPLIVMDNSHVLSDITLQELFRYQQQLKQEHEVTLKILFFANSGMSDTLREIADIQPDQMYVQNMPDYSAKQIDSFIMHRLHNAGYKDQPILGNNDVQRLFKKCNGTPLSVMNEAAPLIDKIIAGKLNPAMALWLKALILIIVLLVLGIAAYAAYTFLLTEKEKTDQAMLAPAVKKIETDISAPIFVPQETTTTEPAVNSEAISLEEVDVIETLENDTPLKTIEAVNAASKIADIKTEPDVDKAIQIKAEKTAADIPVKPVIEKPVVEKKPEPEVKIIKPLNPVLQQLKVTGVRDANWLKQQPANYWTLQLLGAREPKTLLKFSRRHKLGTNAAWYKTWLKAKPYYVLVYGSYTNRDAARNSIAGLSPQLRALKPWPKSLKSIQQALK